VTVLIKDGEHRCDASCYEAKSPASECQCACGGENHGIGRERAIERYPEKFATSGDLFGEAGKVESDAVSPEGRKAPVETEAAGASPEVFSLKSEWEKAGSENTRGKRRVRHRRFLFRDVEPGEDTNTLLLPGILAGEDEAETSEG